MKKTTIYHAQIQKADGKWYYVAMAPFFLEEETALAIARITAHAQNSRLPYFTIKDFRAKASEEYIDENGCIIDTVNELS